LISSKKSRLKKNNQNYSETMVNEKWSKLLTTFLPINFTNPNLWLRSPDYGSGFTRPPKGFKGLRDMRGSL